MRDWKSNFALGMEQLDQMLNDVEQTGGTVFAVNHTVNLPMERSSIATPSGKEMTLVPGFVVTAYREDMSESH